VGTHKRVEAIASRDLRMRLPDPATTVIIAPAGSIGGPGRSPAEGKR